MCTCVCAQMKQREATASCFRECVFNSDKHHSASHHKSFGETSQNSQPASRPVKHDAPFMLDWAVLQITEPKKGAAMPSCLSFGRANSKSRFPPHFDHFPGACSTSRRRPSTPLVPPIQHVDASRLRNRFVRFISSYRVMYT